MARYKIELDSAVSGAIIDTKSNTYVALVETKRPDLGFTQLESIVSKANKTEIPLNDNQQVVLSWLKYWHDHDPFFTLSDLYESVEPGEYKYEYDLDISYEKLSEKERFEVLAAFAAWGMTREVAE